MPEIAKAMEFYTVIVNYDEYAVGLYLTEKAANEKKVALLRAYNPEMKELSDEEILEEYLDGYYRVLKIENT